MAAFAHYAVKKHAQSPIIRNDTLSSSSSSAESYLERLVDELKIHVISLTDDEIIFDLIGVDAAIANSLRRILLAEVRASGCRSPFLMISC
jgi:hypothetical protein